MLAVCGAATIGSASALQPRGATHLRLAPGTAYASDTEELDPGDAQGCGSRSKKTLTDTGAASISFTPIASSVAALRALAPSAAGPGRPRTAPELTSYRVSARLVYAKLELDHDIHLVLQDPVSGGTMIVEFPDPTCPVVAGTPHATEIAAARGAVLRAIGTTDAPRLFGTAEVTGIGFFDLVHGQYGVAPNGIELHPVLGFRLLTQPSLGLRRWQARRSGGWLTERATIRLCTLRAGRYRVLIRDHARNAATRTLERSVVQSSRCNSSTFSWRFPTTSPRSHDLRLEVTVAGGAQLEASRTKTLP